MSVEAVTNDLIQFKKVEAPKLNAGHAQNTILREQISSKQESLMADLGGTDAKLTRLNNAVPSIVQAGEQTKSQVSNPVQEQTQKYDSVMTEKAIENANSRIRGTKTNAKFEYNKDINRITITITDQDNEVVREIPPESTQKMLERIHTFSGMMMDQEI